MYLLNKGKVLETAEYNKLLKEFYLHVNLDIYIKGNATYINIYIWICTQHIA